MHPAILTVYKWFLLGYSSNGGRTYKLDDILLINEHGTLWFCGLNRMSEKFKEVKKFKTILEILTENETLGRTNI